MSVQYIFSIAGDYILGPSVIPTCHGKKGDPDTSNRYRPYALVQLQHLQEMWDSPDAINYPQNHNFYGCYKQL